MYQNHCILYYSGRTITGTLPGTFSGNTCRFFGHIMVSPSANQKPLYFVLFTVNFFRAHYRAHFRAQQVLVGTNFRAKNRAHFRAHYRAHFRATHAGFSLVYNKHVVQHFLCCGGPLCCVLSAARSPNRDCSMWGRHTRNNTAHIASQCKAIEINAMQRIQCKSSAMFRRVVSNLSVQSRAK